MIIVGQDKDLILNFDRVNFIKIEPDENDFDIEINYADDDWDVIATYKSFERAQEVLKEIVSRYSEYLRLQGGPAVLQGQNDVAPAIFNVPKIYEMPKE